MAKTTLRGRFSPGTIVSLYETEGAGVLRAGEADEPIATETVDKNGEVSFSLKEGVKYLVTGYDRGFPREVRLTGRSAEEINTTVFQAPIGPDRVRLADGSWADEEPEKVKKGDLPLEGAPNLGQHQVPEGTPQRSDTIRGTAHPLDPEEPAPYEAQENVEDVPQMSDTETGRATRIVVGPQRQEDVPAGVWQRSDTPTGVATPIPGGGPVEAQETKESSFAKETRGEPGRAAAEPLRTATGGGSSAGGVSNMPVSMTHPYLKIEGTVSEPNRTGLDAMGQPVYPDVARAAGLAHPADKPAASVSGDPKDVRARKKDETPEISGRAAKEEAVPEPSETRRAKPPKGDMAADQTADSNQKPAVEKASGAPKKK